MTRWIAALLVAVGLVGARQAYAQDVVPGPGAVVVTIIPGGATFFTEGKDTKGPSFGNYDLGAGVEVHFNRYVSVEGEVSGALGVTQDLQITGQLGTGPGKTRLQPDTVRQPSDTDIDNILNSWF